MDSRELWIQKKKKHGKGPTPKKRGAFKMWKFILAIARMVLPPAHALALFSSLHPDLFTMQKVKEADGRSYGMVMNSFYELEPDYAKHYTDKLIRSNRVWHISPFSLCNRDQIDMADRGKKAFINTNQCLDWLSSRQPGSVLYFCFGSMCDLTGAQLMEIALALEASGHPFIWVVRNTDQMGKEEEWMPDGFEESSGDMADVCRAVVFGCGKSGVWM